MTCIKTGAHVHIDCYGVWVYGDAFEINHVLILRIVEESRDPIFPIVHFRIGVIDEWFDRDKGDTSTLLARDYVNLGYEGQPL